MLEVLSGRELNNASYYDRLCMQWERELEDPNDVLIEAERRRQQLGANGQQQDSPEADNHDLARFTRVGLSGQLRQLKRVAGPFMP